MRPVKVVTDSTSDLPPDFIDRNLVDMVHLKIRFDDQVYTENVDLSADKFYSIIRQTNIIPSTAPPDFDEFTTCYQKWAPQHDILSIHLSAAFSETVKIAAKAARHVEQKYPESHIHVIDSKSASMGFGLLVKQAAEMAEQGYSLDKIIERITALRQRTYSFFSVNTLTYLRMGGRLGDLSTILPSMIGKKGVLTVDDGVVSLLDRTEPNINMADKIVECMQKKIEAGSAVIAVVLDANSPQKADELVTLIQENFDCQQVLRSTIGPVVGVHAGMGTLAAILQKVED